MTPTHATREAILSNIPEGRCARLRKIEGGGGLRERLAAMGLRPGVQVTVLRNSGSGPFLMAVRHARIAVGRVIAHKIHVTEMSA